MIKKVAAFNMTNDLLENIYYYIWQDTWMNQQFWELETFKTWEL